MDVTEEVTATLRAEAHHPPCVMEAAGFCTEHSANARSILEGALKECMDNDAAQRMIEEVQA